MAPANNTSSTFKNQKWFTRSQALKGWVWLHGKPVKVNITWWTGVLQWNNWWKRQININLTIRTYNYWKSKEYWWHGVTLHGTIKARAKTFQCTGLKIKEMFWLPTATTLQTIFQVFKKNNKSTFTKWNANGK